MASRVIAVALAGSLCWGGAVHPRLAFARKGTGKAPAGTLAPGQAGEDIATLFENGRIAFARGEYARAIEILQPLLYPEASLESEGAIVQAHRMLGVAYLFEGHEPDAKLEFIRLLELRPDYRFDPLLDPPPVVDFFNRILREREKQISAIETRRRDADERRKRQEDEARASNVAPAAIIEHRIIKQSYAVNFVPFGAGQFQNGQTRKGWMFFGAQVVLGGVSLAAFASNFALYGLRPTRACLVSSPLSGGAAGACPAGEVDHTDENRSRWLLRTQILSGGLFWGAVVWGVMDALAHFEAERREERPGAPQSPQNLTHPSLSFAPLLLEGRSRMEAPVPGLLVRF